MPRIVECCCTSLQEVIEAREGGAFRVELCSRLDIGGVTPDLATIRAAVKIPGIKINVLVRPRGGDFVYDDGEVEEMIDTICKCREMGVNGVVIGALKEDGAVDMDVMRKLIGEARPMEVTFHRAFDESADPVESFEQIVELGCERLLTSGHEADALKGSPLIGRLVDQACGRIVVMAGCGVRPENIAKIRAQEYHSSAHGKNGTTDRLVVADLVDDSRQVFG